MTKAAFLSLFLLVISLNAQGGDHSFRKDNMIRDWSGRKDRVQENFDWEVRDIKNKLENAETLTEEEIKKLLERVQKIRAVQEVFKQQAHKLLNDEEVSAANKNRLPELIEIYDNRLSVTKELSLRVLQKSLQAEQIKTQLEIIKAGVGDLKLSY
ncbi:MAG: hypothetical protein EBQ92_09975 [Proteobacteria bacterium]|nr:hypothetical protein [Pseudomonadota bacterium]